MQIHPLLPALPNSMKANPKLSKACKTLIILLRFTATIQSKRYEQVLRLDKKENFVFFLKDKQVHS